MDHGFHGELLNNQRVYDDMWWYMMIYDDYISMFIFFPATYFQTKPLFWGETPLGE